LIVYDRIRIVFYISAEPIGSIFDAIDDAFPGEAEFCFPRSLNKSIFSTSKIYIHEEGGLTLEEIEAKETQINKQLEIINPDFRAKIHKFGKKERK